MSLSLFIIHSFIILLVLKERKKERKEGWEPLPQVHCRIMVIINVDNKREANVHLYCVF